MVDIQAVSIVVASASVTLAAIYYIWQIRHQTRTRQTDLLVRVFSSMSSKDWMEAWEKVRDREFVDYDDYRTRYGFVEANQVAMFFEQVGMLLEKKLIDIDLIPFRAGQVKVTYDRIKPIIEGSRKKFNEPELMHGFEYLYNEMKKREQQQASKTA